ncbi:hypothetical protein MPTK1_2g09460 [Marchantia polymorpha subsp. ruderalis]|nr:hypothetical protein MARPO_0158s0017 [Marchantia polymorpha]BBN01685.1 hypothetical protein Mp_2g09460 [Marchantia polymorpha subsp. ruderalis]|eukprot:PTQ28637.1 hypothetical protein MARPO_0158s0017 [Marchantia polymorpha]
MVLAVARFHPVPFCFAPKKKFHLVPSPQLLLLPSPVQLRRIQKTRVVSMSSALQGARLVPQPKSETKFADPIDSYDVHIYFWQTDEANTALAKELRQECIDKFPDLNIYKFWDTPVGPHPVAMFEVDLKSPDQFLRFVPWIQVNRRGLSVLVHPNTGRPLDDHTKNAMWIGERVPLNPACLPETEPL